MKAGSVYVTVPNGNGWVHKQVAVTLLRLQLDQRYRLRIDLPTHRPFENNLHHIVADFMAHDEDFWLSIDADNPPMNNPLDLVELDKDIIGLPTPVWHWTGEKAGERPIYWNVYDYVGVEGYREHELKSGLQRVDAIGTGCFLLARRVFEDPTMRMAPFEREFHADGTVHKGNDIAFCERARQCGFEIYAHYGYPCRHYNELDLTEVIEAHQRVHG